MIGWPEEERAPIKSLKRPASTETYNSCLNCARLRNSREMKRRTLESFTLRRLPNTLQEHEYSMEAMDKVFSSTWLNDTQIILGTKCQKLTILDTKTGKQVLIPDDESLQDHGNNNQRESKINCSGIHSLAINYSRTLLAVGAGKPNESIKIFRIPTFELVALLEGHSDMVFAVTWLDDNTLVSGSRDKSIKTWKVDQFLQKQTHKNFNNYTLIIYKPVNSQVKHSQKVRDLVYDKQMEQIFTLSADGYVKIWDSKNCVVSASVPLFHTNETVCLAIEPASHLVSVGSQANISLIDPRIGQIVHTFESLDEGWGVRSMNIHSDMVTVGGGLGRISFYDLRAHDYLYWENSENSKNSSLQTGQGWLDKDIIYQRHFHGIPVFNAVYSLSYNESRSKLFACGGPLQLNLRGSYAALWE